MANSLLKTDWLKEDEHVSHVINRGGANLQYAYNWVDRKVITACARKQVNLYSIPRVYSAISGTISSLGTAVSGTNTLFSTELEVGDFLKIGDKVVGVVSIESDTALTITSSITSSDVVAYVGGEVDSIVLRDYAAALGMYKICNAYWGSAKGEKDIYYDKMMEYKQLYIEAYEMLTYDSILGIYDKETGTPDAEESFISTTIGFL